jgi:osmotically-inducible protein OsmY
MTPTQGRTDTDLKSAIVAELAWTPGINSTQIGVAVDRGAVILSGEVESYPERRLAERAAMRVHGVTAIAEEITVHSTWGIRNDTDVAREASHALDSAVNVPSSVKATVHDHRVTLSGDVAWHFEREAAMQAVRYLKGVEGIVNLILVKPRVSASDLKSSIHSAFVRNATLESDDLSITADAQGAVTLEGAVRTFAERRQAEDLAWFAPGVTTVHNRLEIRDASASSQLRSPAEQTTS